MGRKRKKQSSPPLDKFTSYEGFKDAKDEGRHELLDDLYTTYKVQYSEIGLPGVTVPTFNEFLGECIKTLKWRLEYDIPKKKGILPIIVTDVPTINRPDDEDLEVAIQVCKVSIDIITNYLRKGDTFILG